MNLELFEVIALGVGATFKGWTNVVLVLQSDNAGLVIFIALIMIE